ncbi:MAG: DNA-3-methyladenine glycosylase I [Bacteroidota bacterium]|nr:DNA-3-methyladenine glycosylase I [Bacteroidota bacterium]
MKRCDWCENTFEAYIKYHDEEWGVPVYDDKTHFEFMVLESAQAGLSWKTVLQKRSGYRNAFADFDANAVAQYTDAMIEELILDKSIIRNRLKIKAAVMNAQKFLDIQKEFGSFTKYIWSFTGSKPIINQWEINSQVPATSKESDALSKDLIKRGFKFVGSTIMYAHMQATGLVNDHLTKCFRFNEINKKI